MNNGEVFVANYMQDSLRILESAAKVSLKNVTKVSPTRGPTAHQEEDEDLHDYMEQLRDALIECYTAIVHGVSESKNKDVLNK